MKNKGEKINRRTRTITISDDVWEKALEYAFECKKRGERYHKTGRPIEISHVFEEVVEEFLRNEKRIFDK